MTSTGDPLYGMRMSVNRGLALWLPPLALMALIYFLSAQPDLNSGLGVIDLILRKIVHFATYALLCLLLWRPLRTVTTPGRAILLSFAIASAYAVTDEWHQTFVEGRHGTPVDWLIDSAGAALVALRLRAIEPSRRVAS
jgi:VanZ like family